MVKYRIMYWFNSVITDCYIRANSEAEAIKKFHEQKGMKNIVSIEVCMEDLPKYNKKYNLCYLGDDLNER